MTGYTGLDDIDTRRRRAAFRSTHRGTKEMDIMLGRYAAAVLPELTDPELARFELFLQLPDPELQGWLLDGTAIPAAAFAPIVANVRKFHGL